MILVRTFNGGGLSFRTQRGTVHGKLVKGYIVVNVSPIQGRMMRLLHNFHKPPAGFTLSAEEPVKAAPKAVAKKAAPKKRAAPKKKTTRKRTAAKKTTSKG